MGYEGDIKFWDTHNWSEERTVSAGGPGARGCLVSPDGKSIAISMESRVQVHDIASWEQIAEYPVSTKVVSSMTYSPDGKWFAIGAADRKIRLWQLS
jgi:WD40 repeat protein